MHAHCRWRLLVALAAISGCPSSVDDPATRARTPPADEGSVAGEDRDREAPPTTPDKPRFVAASGEGDVAPQVAEAKARADAGKRKLLVYVGADWCEPCKRFHRAVESGELDAELAGVEFLEFDADRDRERLVAAGYGGRLVPRFALPAEDGTFSGRKVEGGTKGEGAVLELMRRLEPLLAAAG